MLIILSPIARGTSAGVCPKMRCQLRFRRLRESNRSPPLRDTNELQATPRWEFRRCAQILRAHLLAAVLVRAEFQRQNTSPRATIPKTDARFRYGCERAVRLLGRIRQYPLEFVAQGQVDGSRYLFPDGGVRVNLSTNHLARAQRPKKAMGERLVLAQDAEEQVLRLHVRRAVLAGFIARKEDRAAGLFCITFEHLTDYSSLAFEAPSRSGLSFARTSKANFIVLLNPTAGVSSVCRSLPNAPRVRYTGRELFHRHEVSRDYLQAGEDGAGRHPARAAGLVSPARLSALHGRRNRSLHQR